MFVMQIVRDWSPVSLRQLFFTCLVLIFHSRQESLTGVLFPLSLQFVLPACICLCWRSCTLPMDVARWSSLPIVIYYDVASFTWYRLKQFVCQPTVVYALEGSKQSVIAVSGDKVEKMSTRQLTSRKRNCNAANVVIVWTAITQIMSDTWKTELIFISAH